jgi:hypothetical protein
MEIGLFQRRGHRQLRGKRDRLAVALAAVSAGLTFLSRRISAIRDDARVNLKAAGLVRRSWTCSGIGSLPIFLKIFRNFFTGLTSLA